MYSKRIAIGLFALSIAVGGVMMMPLLAPAQTCDWKNEFCGPTVSLPNNLSILSRFFQSLPVFGHNNDTGCPDGQALRGIRADGEPICALKPTFGAGGFCQQGEYIVGVRHDGTLVCRQLP